MMKLHWIEKNFTYDGSQLRSLFAYLEYGQLGNSVVAWRGPCAIPLSHMVDGEDKRSNSRIEGSDMLHFIVELFDVQLFSAVCVQRIMASLVIDLLRQANPESELVRHLRRDGDDVFTKDNKVSISIATVSPTSALVHFAVNVSNEGTPVPTAALNDFGVDPLPFAHALMGKLVSEIDSIRQATQKVHWVK